MDPETEEQIITQAYGMAEALRDKTRTDPQAAPESREAYDLLTHIHDLAVQMMRAIDEYDGVVEEVPNDA